MRYLIAVLTMAMTLPVLARDKVLPYEASIYIEDMEGDLDTYIRAQMLKKSVPLKIVMDSEKATYIMTGEATEKEKRRWHEGFLTPGRRDLTNGTIQVLDKVTGELIIAEAVGDGGSNWKFQVGKRGNARLAQKIVSRLKNSVQEKPKN